MNGCSEKEKKKNEKKINENEKKIENKSMMKKLNEYKKNPTFFNGESWVRGFKTLFIY